MKLLSLLMLLICLPSAFGRTYKAIDLKKGNIVTGRYYRALKHTPFSDCSVFYDRDSNLVVEKLTAAGEDVVNLPTKNSIRKVSFSEDGQREVRLSARERDRYTFIYSKLDDKENIIDLEVVRCGSEDRGIYEKVRVDVDCSSSIKCKTN